MLKQLSALIALATLLAAVSTANAAPLGTSFTYQGELQVSSAPANGVYDLQFRLFNALSGGVAVGSDVLVDNATVSNGIFNVELDFGAAPFGSDQLWLEIGVRDGASTGGYQTLAPRQKLTATPYALRASKVALDAIGSAEIINNSVTAADLATNSVGVDELADGAVDTAAVQNNAITSAKLATNSVGTSEINSTQVQRRVSGSCESDFYLAGINEDGSVLCEMLPVGLARTLDTTGYVGDHTSIAIRPSSGFPIISYFDNTNGSLKVYDCSNAACSAGTARTLDAVGVGQYTGIAIHPGNGELPIISYHDFTNVRLKVYSCGDSQCEN